ncbi:MAG: N-6 DNA methylase, partial [Acidobacteria bacterium]|nr:N-6 DNA methylase [Acidobacteriota bacterium]
MLPGFAGHLISEFFLEHRGCAAPATESPDPAAARCLRALKEWRRQCAALGPASSARAMLEIGAAPFAAALGFHPPDTVAPLKGGVAATLRAPRGAAALVVTLWSERLDPFWRTAVIEAERRSARWCLLFNGTAVRLVDAGRLYARRHVEFDLDLAIEDARSFAALWSLIRADVIGDPARLDSLITESDRHAAGVCRSLRDGVLSASTDILAALIAHSRRSRRAQIPPPAEAFEQALTLVYRMLFLLFAEARGLVPLWHPVYRESYSIEALRDAAAHASRADGSWDALRAIGRLAHAGCHAGDLRVTPFNGRLFAPSRTPLAERRDLDDGAARRAVLALSMRASTDGAGRERISYRDLGVEQLGAVYETLLDYEPRVERPAEGRPSVGLKRGSSIRKGTGSFYTPQPLADHLVRRTLDPLTRTATPERILQLRIVDPAMGSGAFLVAACRYLAAAYETALVRSGGCHPSDIGETERATIRRTIAERCLYGVDLNPMAVQLARLSLWLATLAADRPLTFLDHRLQVGDSLLGAWLSNLRHAPAARRRRTTDDPPVLPLFDEGAVRGVMTGVLPVRFQLESIPADTLELVRQKERAHSAMIARGTALSRWKRVADLWCATWFAASGGNPPSNAFASLSDAILGSHCALPTRIVESCLAAAEAVSRRRRFFHWELEFPEAFFDADGGRRYDGGFDAVIGNPPWDMVRADAGSQEGRPQLREDVAALVRFTRDAGIYTAQSDGHANRYQLFVERAVDLTRHGGRIGLVLPSGLATDRGSAPLRRRLLSRCDIDAMVGFDNHRGVFPIHRSVRFLLATATAGSPTREIACRLGESDVSTLDEAGSGSPSWFPVRITPEFLHRVSGGDLSIPWLRESADLAILERAAALFPPLGSAEGWAVAFGRELNASDDRDAFRPSGQGLPIVEGKQLEPFRVDLESARYSISAREAGRRLDRHRYDSPRLGYRDVASATNRLTLIAAVLPAGCVSTHTVFVLRSPLPPAAQHLLCGFFNSLVVNYLVRLRVSTHVTTGIVERLPIPRADQMPRACREIAAIARLLARRHDPKAMALLQARVAGLYQLNRAEFAHVLDTFPLIPREERALALQTYVATEAQ